MARWMSQRTPSIRTRSPEKVDIPLVSRIQEIILGPVIEAKLRTGAIVGWILA